MSGLTAIINFDKQPVSQNILTMMTEQVAYRGPHGISYQIQNGAGFAHLSLRSTPESVFESQPLVHPETGVTIVADARIDNRAELLTKMHAQRMSETPVTDVEIILSAYLRWGKAAAKELLGDFAFLVWDPRIREVFAARDPMGIRNCHFAVSGQTLMVASEAQQILQHPTISNDLNESAIIEWVTGQVSNKHCMFKDIQVLQAGNYLVANAKGWETKRFWDIDPSRVLRYRNVHEYEEHFLSLLDDAVQARLRTHSGSVGAELSGGLDSTSIVALASRQSNKSNLKLNTISYQYPGTPGCDETRYIESASRHLSRNPYYVDAETEGALTYPKGYQHTLESPWVREYPFMNKGLQFLKDEGADVLLTGNGGDELTTGGHLVSQHRLFRGDLSVLIELAKYCRQHKLSFTKASYHEFLEPHLTKSADNVLRKLLQKESSGARLIPAWITANGLELGQSQSRQGMRKQFKNIASQAMYDNLIEGPGIGSYGAYELMASRYNMEVRHPFLDQNVIEFCFAVPIGLWQKSNFPKWLMRSATRGLLPDDVRWRLDKSLSTEVFGKAISSNLGYIRKVMETNYCSLAKLYDAGILRNTFESHYQQNGVIARSDIDFALSLQCWLHTNRSELNLTERGSK